MRTLIVLLIVITSASAFSKIKKKVHNYPQTSVVIRADTGKLIYSNNAQLSIVPASITKVMTLYLLFEALEHGKLTLSSKLPVSFHASKQAPGKLWLKPGQSINVADAIKALIVRSANDVACVVAEAVSGTEKNFAKRMTKKAKELGMNKTTFANASGLPNKLQRSTAYDLALLSRAIWKDFPERYKLFGTKKWRIYRNHNKLLGHYPGMDGLKTGYTRAGYNLAASTDREGLRLFGVVIGHKTSQERNLRMTNMLDRVYQRKLKKKVKTNIIPALMIDPKRKWSVQVGAYKTKIKANEIGVKAKTIAKNLLVNHLPEVTETKVANGNLHRCRFNSLEHGQARNCCRVLRTKGLPCLVISHK